MTLHDIIQKNNETFEKTFPSIKDIAEKVGDTYGFPIYIQLKDFLLSSQLSIIQAIDEWAEGKKKEIKWEVNHGFNGDKFKTCSICGYMENDPESVHICEIQNAALSDLRSFLSEAKTKLQ